MRHCPTGGGLKFGCSGMKRLEVVQMRAVPLVSRCVEFEMNLVEPPDEVDCQAGTIFLLGQSADKTRWQTHLEESTLATARTVVEPTLEQTEITRHLVSGREQENPGADRG